MTLSRLSHFFRPIAMMTTAPNRTWDGVAGWTCFERFGLFHADLALPPDVASWMGFVATVPLVGFYRHGCGDVVALSEQGFQYASNVPVLTAILARAAQRAPIVMNRLESAFGRDAELCIAVEPRIAKGWYLGTVDHLHRFFGIPLGTRPSGAREERREHSVTFASTNYNVTQLERMTFLALMQYFVGRP